MNMVNGMTKLMTLMVAIAMVSSVTVMFSIESDASSSDYMVLIDNGNGDTDWVPQIPGGTVQDILIETLKTMDITMSVTGDMVSVNGLTETNIGAPGAGSYVVSGSTGVTVKSTWNVYKWNGDAWAIASLSESVSNTHLALAFGPSDYIPVETPDHRTSWVMIRGDSRNTGNMDSGPSITDVDASIEWIDEGAHYASLLHVGKYIIAKYGMAGDMGTQSSDRVILKCYDYESGDVKWEFSHPGIDYYEAATPLIVSDHIYVPSCYGYVFKFDWREGPGELQAGVWSNDVWMTAPDGTSEKYDESKLVHGGCAPISTGAELSGTIHNTGNSSLIYDSGAIFFCNSNGMTYCIDRDLNLLWSFQSGGSMYYTAPSIVDGYVFFGALNGGLYILDKVTGEVIDQEIIFTDRYIDEDYGSVSTPAVFKDGSAYRLILPISEGRGMSNKVGGYATATFDGVSIGSVDVVTTEFGIPGNYFTIRDSDDFRGVYAFTDSPTDGGLYSVDIHGNATLLSNEVPYSKGPLNLINDSYIIFTSYAPTQTVYKVGFDGRIISTAETSTKVASYCMTSVLVIGDWVFVPNDAGLTVIHGAFAPYVYDVTEPPASTGAVLLVVGIIMLVFVAYYCLMRFGFKKDRPFGIVTDRVKGFLGADPMTHNTRSKHRLFIVMVLATLLSAGMFVICLCVGPTSVMSPIEAVKSMFTAIGKGGSNLSYDELMVFSSRLPRTLVALIIGIGLSMAGVMYQALIRNPLVDPYIMGVSSGAGTAAVAVIGFNFTFFGLFPAHSLYLTAFAAMVGGILAFAITMLLAEKAGGSSINYVLAGVVVGLVFSAVQSIMLTTSPEQVSSSLSWLYGSFSSVSWEHVAIIMFPVLAMSLAPLIWAKEFNLVLLGEDQARQMGLNVVWFNRIMLVLASVLTSLCVAFVGIIGFVGLVIPHLCRMILGGDHRLVMPASIALGGFLMMFADLLSRILWSGIELPVGAITTLIGIPVFAWLLIKRGKMYDG